MRGIVKLGISVWILFAVCNSFASDVDPKYYSIRRVKISSVSKDVLNQEVHKEVFNKSTYSMDWPYLYGKGNPSPLDNVGSIISEARDIVALGQDIYNLVTKGRPSNVTSYAPVSVIPKVNGEPADLFSTENWSDPVKATYQIVYENFYGIEVVKFRYSLIFSHSGTFDGKGAYILGAQIIPESVRTMFGYDLTATMKVGGVQNSGTRVNPVAGATLLMELTVRTVMVANVEVFPFFITGKGRIKKL